VFTESLPSIGYTRHNIKLIRSLRCCVKHGGKITLPVSIDLDDSGRGSSKASEAQEAIGQLRFGPSVSQIQSL
jgi:hypothetical protein